MKRRAEAEARRADAEVAALRPAREAA
jgi:hypothetical protein